MFSPLNFLISNFILAVQVLMKSITTDLYQTNKSNHLIQTTMKKKQNIRIKIQLFSQIDMKIFVISL